MTAWLTYHWSLWTVTEVDTLDLKLWLLSWAIINVVKVFHKISLSQLSVNTIASNVSGRS